MTKGMQKVVVLKPFAVRRGWAPVGAVVELHDLAARAVIRQGKAKPYNPPAVSDRSKPHDPREHVHVFVPPETLSKADWGLYQKANKRKLLSKLDEIEPEHGLSMRNSRKQLLAALKEKVRNG